MKPVAGRRRSARAALVPAAAAAGILSLALIWWPSASLASPPSWLNARQPPGARAAELLHAMTLDDVLALVSSGAEGNARLGIPPLSFIDGPNGIGEGSTGVTAFPDAQAIAAAWDPSLARRYGVALGAEAAGKGHTLLAAPTVNIVRQPLWGREAESVGEDPFLASRIVAPEVQGIQSQHVIAEVKHFVAYDQETDRFGDPLAGPAIDAQVSTRALEEIYLPPFKAAVQQGHVASVMCSYNRINGVYSCQDPATLSILRDWGFAGFVEPDARLAVRDDVAAANAGTDNFQLGSLLSSSGGSDETALRAALDAETLPRKRLQEMAGRILFAMFEAGLFDHPRTGSANRVVSTPAHRSLATAIAEQSTVLLKNSGGTLPLSSRTGSIAVIGYDAGPGTQIEENGSPAVLHGPVITPLDGIRQRAPRAVRVSYDPGTLGVVPLRLVPSSVLTPSNGRGSGLSADYYPGTTLSGTPVLKRTDPEVSFAGEPVPLAPIPGTTASSARWSGSLRPPRTGLYRFSLTVSGVARMYLAGKLVVHGDAEFDNADLGSSGLGASPGGPTISFQGTTRLVRNHLVAIRVDYSTASSIAGAQLHLGWQPPQPELLGRAVDAARRARVAVVFANDVASEGMDRTSLSLPGDQDRLITAVAHANPHTIVVLHTSGPVLMPWLREVAGVLEAWYPGQQSGRAIAATLFGDSDPSGRLPVTFPASQRQGPATKPAEYPGVNGIADHSEGIYVGYRYYDRYGQRPLFPFGFGLSYTRFRLRDLRVKHLRGQRFLASLQVRNTGDRAGAEVVQLYVDDPPAAGEPPHQLKGFVKLALPPGRARTVRIGLDSASFAIWNTRRSRWSVPAGRYRILAGSSSRNLPLAETIEVH